MDRELFPEGVVGLFQGVLRKPGLVPKPAIEDMNWDYKWAASILDYAWSNSVNKRFPLGAFSACCFG